ncbi:SDR family NAD(P)-dependent oxidoreductase [Minwuia thermotolerans]|uniref:SDR family NAD(P)-dependent oxidoreductase n=1 Tax=Minwuia thermotolerans TaxID=2056226 RepID=UPI0019D107D5|nr:SDR family oxidoreductase [Minwuia thermotolerans]
MLDLGLEDKVAIITGGSDGLGRATAHRMAAEGAKVVICARRGDYLQTVARELADDTGGTVLGVQADVCRAADCEKLIEAAREAFGGVDILVNNAGASAAAGFMDVTDEGWQADFDLKIMGAVRMCRGVIPMMRQRGGGAIVNATIGWGKAPGSAKLPTSLSRAAGINLTKSLANEYAADNIRVNTVCIGLIKSAQWTRRADGDAELAALYDRMSGQVPLGRMGEAEEYGDLVAFLCSKRGAYITGTAINLDGGMCPVV